MATANGKTPPKGTKAELAEIDTLMKKAVDLHRKEHLDAAVGIYRKVLEKKPGFIPAIGMLGTALGQMHQFDASVKLLKQRCNRFASACKTWQGKRPRRLCV